MMRSEIKPPKLVLILAFAVVLVRLSPLLRVQHIDGGELCIGI